jgi:phage-related protein
MRFYASSFQYNGVPSEKYGLEISELGGDGESSSSASNQMEVYDRRIYRRATPFFYGLSPSENLSFDISINSLGEDIDTEKSKIIQAWLFSQRTYKKLFIIQPDMTNSYYNCFFNNPEIVQVGSAIRGYKATVVCDSPYGWKYPKTLTNNYTGVTVDSTFTFYNSSDDKGAYLYPSLVLTMNTTGGTITITNESDSFRVTSFTGLSASEVITIDSSLQILTSSTGLNRMSNFNKKFLRLVPGVNNIRVQGNIQKLEMTYQLVAKI